MFAIGPEDSLGNRHRFSSVVTEVIVYWRSYGLHEIKWRTLSECGSPSTWSPLSFAAFLRGFEVERRSCFMQLAFDCGTWDSVEIRCHRKGTQVINLLGCCWSEPKYDHQREEPWTDPALIFDQKFESWRVTTPGTRYFMDTNESLNWEVSFHVR